MKKQAWTQVASAMVMWVLAVTVSRAAIPHPVAYWPLRDGTPGDQVAGADDLIDNASHPATDATSTGSGGTWAVDPERGIVYRTVQGHRLSAGTQGITTNFTWSLWVKILEDNNGTIMGTRAGNPWNKLTTGGMGNWAGFGFSSGTIPQNSDWIHIAVRGTVNPGGANQKVECYMDGAAAGTDNNTASLTFNGALQLGGNNSWNEDIGGLMSDVAVWTNALSEAQILELYNGSNIITDTTAPVLVDTTPDDDDGNASSALLRAIFDEPIVIGSGNIRIVDDTDSQTNTIAVTDGTQVTVSGAQMTIDPTAALIAGKAYHIEMDAGVVKNIEGLDFAGIADSTTWNFTVDNTPPTVSSIDDNVGGGPIYEDRAEVTYTVTFSEPIDGTTVDTNDFDNAGSATIAIASVTQTSPAVFVVVVEPSSTGTLQLRIPTGSVVSDTSGNSLVVPVTDGTITINAGTDPSAGDRWWDPNSVGVTDGASGGGAGTWSTSDAEWDRGVGFADTVAWHNGNSNSAIFGGTPATVTLSGSATVSNISFTSTSGGYDIQGGTLSFVSGATIRNSDNRHNHTFSCTITGSPEVRTKDYGAGNQYHGLIFAPSGGHTQTLGVVINPENTGNTDKAGVYLSGSTVGNSVTSISYAGGDRYGTVYVQGTGSWTVGDILMGTLRISGGNLVMNGEIDTRYGGIVLTGGVLHYNNAGTVKNGGFNLQGGALDNTSGSAIGTSTYNPPYTVSGDFAFIGSNGADSDLNLGTGAVTLSGADRTVTVQNSAATLTVGGAISGSGLGLIKAGDGTLALDGVNTFTGPTTVNAGTLSGTGTVGIVSVANGGALAPGASIGTFSASNVTIAAGGTLAVEIDDTQTPMSDTLAVSHALDITDATLDVAAAGAPGQFVYVIATYGSLTGTFGVITNMPIGYAIDYAHDGGTAIAIIDAGPETQPVVTNLGAIAGIGTATLRGEVTDGRSASATICWGTSDGGTASTGNWQVVASIGAVNQNTPFSTSPTGLLYGVEYTCRIYVTNSAGDAWSAPETFATLYPGVEGESLGWSYTNWTGDTDSGIGSDETYTAAHCFGNNHGGSVIVNGVTFTESFAASGSGWSMAGGQNNWNGDDDAAVTGSSEDLAEEFVYNGNPRTVQFSGLTAGTRYRATFYSVGFEASGRVQTFSSGGNDLVVDQDAYGDNAGITISYEYEATAATQDFTITPAGGTFHMYALSNRKAETPVPLGIETTAAVNITETTADLVGTLEGTGSVFDVTVYWGTNDNSDAAAWLGDGSASKLALGTYTNVSGLSVTGSVSALTGGTVYYYTMVASNAVTNIWATPNAVFGTDGPPTLVNAGYTPEGGYATLSGNVISTGGLPVAVRIYWGETDGGTDAASWANTNIFSGTRGTGEFSTNTTAGLIYGVQYYYRCFASNANGVAWAPVTSGFVTAPEDVFSGPGSYLWDFWDGGKQDNDWTVLHGEAWYLSNNGGGVDSANSAGTGHSGDGAHPTFLFESPVFRFNGGTVNGTHAIRFAMSTGAGDQAGDGPDFDTPEAVLAYNGGNSDGNGEKGLAFYNLDTGVYDAVFFHSGNNNNPETFELTSAELTAAGVDLSGNYVLNYYDNDSGGWGWTVLNWIDIAADLVVPSPIGIENLAVSPDFTSTSATFNATFDGTLSFFDVYVYWGTSDGGTDAGAWGQTNLVGSYTDVGPTNLSFYADTLSSDTRYHYAFCAQNAATNMWAQPSTSFKTVGTPTIDNGVGPTPHIFYATLSGELLEGGRAGVSVYWGLSDGGTNAASWEHTNTLQVVGNVAFSSDASNLIYGLQYHYRCYATNAFGDDWANATTNFVSAYPSDLRVPDGVQLWLQADKGAQSDGSGVVTWQDQSDNGNHATRAGGRGNAELVADQVNGLPVVQFRNEDVYIGQNMFAKEMYWVFKSGYSSQVFGPDWGTVLSPSANWASGSTCMLQPNNTAFWTDARARPATVSKNGTALSSPWALGSVDSPVGDCMVVKVVVDDNNTTPRPYKVGGQMGGGWGNTHLDIAEIVAYDRTLSAAEENEVGGYLAWKYGVGTSYSSFTPAIAIANAHVSNVAAGEVQLNATLTADQVRFDVWVYWSTNDYGTNKTSWLANGDSHYVGAYTNVTDAGLGHLATGLAASETYYYAFYASNMLHETWAQPSMSFGTLGAPSVDNAGGASDLVPGGATLNGELLTGGTADVTVCWGYIDAGTNGVPADWQHTESVGSVFALEPFSADISGTLYGLTYYYTCFVTNSVGSGWSPVTNFTTLPPLELLVTNGLQAHFDAGAGTTTDGSGVATWLDQSGNGHTATRAEGTLQLLGDQVNGLPAVKFVDNSRATIASNMYSKTQFIVTKMINAGDWGAWMGSQPRSGYMWNRNGSAWSANYPASASKNGSALTPTAFNVGYDRFDDFMVLKIVGNDNDTSQRLYELGRAEYNGGWDRLQNYMAEVLSYDVELSAEEENKVGAYLAAKYDLATTYPALPYPYVENTGVTDLLTGEAKLNGTLYATESVYDVWVYWSTDNGGTSKAAWLADGDSQYMGSFTNVASTGLVHRITGLPASTTHYYNYYASNVAAEIWGDSYMFGSAGAPTVENRGATDIDVGTAALRGELTAGGLGDITICWGTTDAGTNNGTTAWDHVETLGTKSSGIVFTNTVTDAFYGITYYYRCYVTNAWGSDWADSADTFMTEFGSSHVYDGDDGYLVHRGYHVNNDGWLDLNNNGGVMDTNTYVPYGTTTLTAGPGNRGLNFDNDNDFKGTGAINQDNNYMNFFFGYFTAPETGDYKFQLWERDDPCGIWLDLDRDGVFESTQAGLGANRGEQLAWNDRRGVHTVSLEEDEVYMFAATHREGGGGSQIDVQFETPSLSWRTVKPTTDAEQEGMWRYWLRDEPAYSITNELPSDLAPGQAQLNATLRTEGAVYDVTVYWSTNDGGTNAAAWLATGSSAHVGAFTNVVIDVGHTAGSLSEGTTYYYAFRGTNELHEMWAQPSMSFNTMSAPTVDNGGGATNLGIGTASLQGELTSGGAADIYVCWGMSDAGTNGGTAAWDHVEALGQELELQTFAADISGTYYGVRYYYRCYATNAVGSDWSDSAVGFTTEYPGVEGGLPATNAVLYHLDAGAIQGLADGASVSQWDDLSGNDRHFTQGTAGRRPLYKTGVINSMPAIRFDGGDDQLTWSGVTAPETVFIVNSVLTHGSLDGVWGSSNPGDKGIRLADATSWRNNDNNDFMRDDGDSYVNGTSTRSYGSLGTWHILMQTRGSSHTSPYNVTHLGGYYSGRYIDADVAEVIAYDRVVTSEEHDAIGAYLAYKYGLTTAYGGYRPPVPIGIANVGATNVTRTTADLVGVLEATGSVFEVSLYWGTNDNADAAAWMADGDATRLALGTYTNVWGHSVTGSVSSLTSDRTYYYTMVASNAVTNIWAAPNVTFEADYTPPSPSPMTFAVVPTTFDEHTIVMTATTATDPAGPVEYTFENTSNSNVRAWNTSTVWTNSGLIEGRTYGYRVKARDALLNETEWSAEETAVAQADGTPPTPNPMTFATAPAPIHATAIGMTATTATDVSEPVEYYFQNTTNGRFRDWSTSTEWINTGLTRGETYGYRVKARDAMGNETAWSAVVNATAAPVKVPVASYVYDGTGSGAGPDGSFPDTGTSELTDGQLPASTAYQDGAWVGYRDDLPDDGTSHPQVTFDFGSIRRVESIEATYLHSTSQTGGNITAPESVLISISSDGVTYSTPVSFSAEFDSSAGDAIRVATLDATGLSSARYYRLDFRNSSQWAFFAEVTFWEATPPSPPGMVIIVK